MTAVVAARDERERLHELRSTMAGLVNGSALLDHADIDDASRTRIWGSVRHELDRMQRLLSEEQEETASIDLDEALGRMLDLQGLKGRRVELRTSGELVQARPDALAEVVNILVDNAATHGGSDSSLIEVARRDEETVDITVTDFGRGIAEEDREAIFEWGRRGPDSPGEGIGLHLAQRLVTEDGGSLRLREAKGTGSSFVISLPAPRRSPEDHVSADPGRGGPSCLAPLGLTTASSSSTTTCSSRSPSSSPCRSRATTPGGSSCRTEGGSMATVQSLAMRANPRTVLLDLDLGRFGDAMVLIAPLARAHANVVVLTASQDEGRWGACMRLGARKVLPKSGALQHALGTVRRLHQGLPVVTREELEGLIDAWARERRAGDDIRRRLELLDAARAPGAGRTDRGAHRSHDLAGQRRVRGDRAHPGEVDPRQARGVLAAGGRRAGQPHRLEARRVSTAADGRGPLMGGIGGCACSPRAPSRPRRSARWPSDLRHRGPDGSGTWIGDDVGLAHARLAIVDGDHGQQPLLSADGRWALVLDGEVLNHTSLRAQLDYPFRTRSDAEVVLAGLATVGIGFVAQLRGQFAFVAHDRLTGTTHLVRDRLGILPLHYRHVPGGIAFASEVKALLAVGPPPRVDHRSLDDYLGTRSVPAPHTLFEGVKKVRPAHRVAIGPGGHVEEVHYWTPPESDPEGTWSQSDATEAVGDGVREAVRSAFAADVPVGAHLSGELDCSLVVAQAQELRDDPLHTFSVGFGDRTADGAGDDVASARRVADLLGTRHHEVLVQPHELEELWSRLTWHRDAPIGDLADVAAFASRTSGAGARRGDRLRPRRRRAVRRARPVPVRPPRRTLPRAAATGAHRRRRSGRTPSRRAVQRGRAAATAGCCRAGREAYAPDTRHRPGRPDAAPRPRARAARHAARTGGPDVQGRVDRDPPGTAGPPARRAGLPAPDVGQGALGVDAVGAARGRATPPAGRDHRPPAERIADRLDCMASRRPARHGARTAPRARLLGRRHAGPHRARRPGRPRWPARPRRRPAVDRAGAGDLAPVLLTALQQVVPHPRGSASLTSPAPPG